MEKINIPLFALCLLSLRSVILGAGIGDAITIVALAGIYAYDLYLKQLKVIDINLETKDKLEVLQKQMNEIKDNVVALKISRTYNKLG